MRMMEELKKYNRTLLEMYMGILFWGLVCQLAGLLLTKERGIYAWSLWFGILLALVSVLHMYRSLDRALEVDEKSATKLIYRSYLVRYAAVAVILLLVMVSGVMNPLVVFLAYMGLKVAAYLQPITHKLCNRMFHETDPVPEALPEETDAKTNER